MNSKTKSKCNTHTTFNFICKPLANSYCKIKSLISDRYVILPARINDSHQTFA